MTSPIPIAQTGRADLIGQHPGMNVPVRALATITQIEERAIPPSQAIRLAVLATLSDPFSRLALGLDRAGIPWLTRLDIVGSLRPSDWALGAREIEAILTVALRDWRAAAARVLDEHGIDPSVSAAILPDQSTGGEIV